MKDPTFRRSSERIFTPEKLIITLSFSLFPKSIWNRNNLRSDFIICFITCVLAYNRFINFLVWKLMKLNSKHRVCIYLQIAVRRRRSPRSPPARNTVNYADNGQSEFHCISQKERVSPIPNGQEGFAFLGNFSF